MRKIIAAFLISMASAPLLNAEDRIVTPQEFQQLSEGKTMYFSQDGFFFGAEQFYTRKRSLWQNSAKECLDGEWYAKGDLICFEYGLETDPACWRFLKTGEGYVARSEGSTADWDIFMYNIDTKPLDCKGPAVGA